MKFSDKLVWTFYEDKRDKERIRDETLREITELEERAEGLQNEIVELTESNHKKEIQIDNLQEELEKLRNKKDCDLLNAKIQQLENDKANVENLYANLRKSNTDLALRNKELEDKIKNYDLAKQRKCSTCDSHINGGCKCNDTLGYEYCSIENGFKGYRQLIKEME